MKQKPKQRHQPYPNRKQIPTLTIPRIDHKTLQDTTKTAKQEQANKQQEPFITPPRKAAAITSPSLSSRYWRPPLSPASTPPSSPSPVYVEIPRAQRRRPSRVLFYPPGAGAGSSSYSMRCRTCFRCCHCCCFLGMFIFF